MIGRRDATKDSELSRVRTSRRAAANKNVSVKNNPFKQNQPQVGQKASFKLPGKKPATTSGGVDAASSNIEKLLSWLQRRLNQYQAVNITNFTTSWEDGIALCALMNYLLGDEKLDTTEVSPTDKLKNFKLALAAGTEAGVPEILDAEELAKVGIERRSMITYLHMVYTKLFAEKKEEKDKAKAKEKEEEA